MGEANTGSSASKAGSFVFLYKEETDGKPLVSAWKNRWKIEALYNTLYIYYYIVHE